MRPWTTRARTQLRLGLEPPIPAAPRSAALVRALADLLLEALHREMIATDRKERIGELEDHV